MSSSPSLFIVGSGPGIALATAKKFASEGLNIALISRNASRLAEEARSIQSSSSSGIKVFTGVADASDYDQTVKVLNEAKQQLGEPTVLLYNAASLGFGFSDPLEVTPQVRDTEPSSKSLTLVGAFNVLKWGASNVKASGSFKPTILVTGGAIGHDLVPTLLPLSAAKAGVINMTKVFHDTLKPREHVATISVTGAVSDDHPTLNPPAIAQKFWEIAVEKECETLELVY